MTMIRERHVLNASFLQLLEARAERRSKARGCIFPVQRRTTSCRADVFHHLENGGKLTGRLPIRFVLEVHQLHPGADRG